MTTEQALQQAIRLFPLDLVGRLNYIEMKRDTCDIENLGAWNEAAKITRNGTPLITGPPVFLPPEDELPGPNV